MIVKESKPIIMSLNQIQRHLFPESFRNNDNEHLKGHGIPASVVWALYVHWYFVVLELAFDHLKKAELIILFEAQLCWV